MAAMMVWAMDDMSVVVMDALRAVGTVVSWACESVT